MEIGYEPIRYRIRGQILLKQRTYTKRFTGSKLVHRLLAEYPECAYWFKAYFASDVVLTAAYPYLIKFYERWQRVIGQMLAGIVPNKLAEKIAVIYVDVLKACLLNSNGGSAISDIFPAKFFLFKCVGRILQGEFD